MFFKTEIADNRIGDMQAILIDPNSGNLSRSTGSPRPGQAIGLDKRK